MTRAIALPIMSLLESGDCAVVSWPTCYFHVRALSQLWETYRYAERRLRDNPGLQVMGHSELFLLTITISVKIHTVERKKARYTLENFPI